MIPRYSRPEMVALWTAPARLRRWRDVELAALEGMVKAGIAPEDAFVQCRARAGDFDDGDAVRIEEIERTTRHDVIAFLTFMEERIGPAARWLHFGMTSSDVLDTSLGMILRDAADLLLAGVDRAMAAVKTRAFEHRRTVMMGRSHGIHAEPMSFGHKLAIWYDELRRGRERLVHARTTIAVGKISGAVGTFAHLPPAVEEHACRVLGLSPAPASSQVIQRDRHAEYFGALALIASSIEKFAVEIRHLQRTEVREVEEPFSAGQKGSSAMPHKRNPVTAEQICGLARVVRANAQVAFENIAQWHERDISHSSAERIILPDSCILADYLVSKTEWLIDGLSVYPARMRKNLESLGGVTASGELLLELTWKGLSREDAYSVVQPLAMRVWDEGASFRDLVDQDEVIKEK